MTRYTQLVDTAGSALIEAARPFEDFAVGVAAALARNVSRVPAPTLTTVPVLVAEQVAAYSNLLAAQRDVLTRLRYASTPAAAAGPKDVRVKRPAAKTAAKTAAVTAASATP
jgi:hypothetical protein